MAKVIFEGPTPPRPPIFGPAFGNALLQGMVFKKRQGLLEQRQARQQANRMALLGAQQTFTREQQAQKRARLQEQAGQEANLLAAILRGETTSSGDVPSDSFSRASVPVAQGAAGWVPPAEPLDLAALENLILNTPVEAKNPFSLAAGGAIHPSATLPSGAPVASPGASGFGGPPPPSFGSPFNRAASYQAALSPKTPEKAKTYAAEMRSFFAKHFLIDGKPSPGFKAALALNPKLFQTILDFIVPKKRQGFTLSPGQTRHDPTGKTIAKGPEEAPTPQSPIGKLRQDYRNGLISKEVFERTQSIFLDPKRLRQIRAYNKAFKDGDITHEQHEFLMDLVLKNKPLVNISLDQKKDKRELRNDKVKVVQVIEAGKRLYEQITTKSIGAHGDVSRAIGSLVSQATQFARSMGVKIKAKRSISTHKKLLDRLIGPAPEAAIIKSNVLNLAYALAAVSGQRGKDVSDNDVVRFIKILGANTGDPDQFRAVLKQVFGILDQNHRIKTWIFNPGQYKSWKDVESLLPDVLRLTSPSAPKPSPSAAKPKEPGKSGYSTVQEVRDALKRGELGFNEAKDILLKEFAEELKELGVQ